MKAELENRLKTTKGDAGESEGSVSQIMEIDAFDPF